jgi:excinuclease ABC subunit C
MNDKISKLQGDKFIKTILKDIPENSGIYKMFDSNNKILYVGKAKNLKNRITNYSKLEDNSLRIQSMIKLIAKLEWIITLNETDALILEADLIKSLKPKYNIELFDNYDILDLYVITLGKEERIANIKNQETKIGKKIFSK